MTAVGTRDAPHRPDHPLSGPCAWRGDALERSAAWLHTWSSGELQALDAAARAARDGGRPLAAVGATEFPVPGLRPLLAELRRELLDGRGFVVLRGLDVADRERAATIFWGLGAHLGAPRPQNARGHLLGHVVDLGLSADDPATRIYQTRERQGFHTDSADLVGLLCFAPAIEGGRSALVSAATLHNVLLERSPGLLETLFQPFCTDHRGEFAEGGRPYFTAPVFSWHAGHLSVLYQRRYIESAQRFPDVPRLTPRQIAALDALDAAADDPSIHLEMDLQPGDIQLIHNHQMLHDRTAYTDAPDRKRHLLRLWLCPPGGRPLPPWFAERLGSVTPGDRGGVALRGVAPVASLDP